MLSGTREVFKLAHNMVCCTECGREFSTAPEHFIPKCLLQHELRTRILCVKDGMRMIKREMKILEDFVEEYCSHCKKKED